jgi:hypothetical protein
MGACIIQAYENMLQMLLLTAFEGISYSTIKFTEDTVTASYYRSLWDWAREP